MPETPTFNFEIDKTDREIITILTENANTPYTEIAKRLIISSGTVHVRMKRLKRLGVVKSSTLLFDHTKLGYDLTAFLGVFLDKGSVYQKVIAELKKIPEVVEAHYTTGKYSIFVKVICRNTMHLRDVLNEKIQAIPGVQSTETIVSLEESIKRQVAIPPGSR